MSSPKLDALIEEFFNLADQVAVAMQAKRYGMSAEQYGGQLKQAKKLMLSYYQAATLRCGSSDDVQHLQELYASTIRTYDLMAYFSIAAELRDYKPVQPIYLSKPFYTPPRHALH